MPGLLKMIITPAAIASLAAGCAGEAEETPADTSYEETQSAPVDLSNPDDAPVPDNEVGDGLPVQGDMDTGDMDTGGGMRPAEDAMDIEE